MATARELKATIVARAAMARAPMPRYSGREGVSIAAQRAHAAAHAAAAAAIITAIRGTGVNSLPAISQVLNAAAVPTAGGKGVWTAPELHRVLSKAREDQCAVQEALAAHQVVEELIRKKTVGLSANEAAAAINARGVTTVTGKPWIAATVKYWRSRLKIRTDVKRDRVAARATELVPIIAEIQAAGITSHHGIAAAFNARGIPTASGKGRWYNHTVRQLLTRLKPAPPVLADTKPNPNGHHQHA